MRSQENTTKENFVFKQLKCYTKNGATKLGVEVTLIVLQCLNSNCLLLCFDPLSPIQHFPVGTGLPGLNQY